MTPTSSNKPVQPARDSPSAEPTPQPRDDEPKPVKDNNGQKQDNAIRSQLHKMQVLRQFGGTRAPSGSREKPGAGEKTEDKEGGAASVVEGGNTLKESFEAAHRALEATKGVRGAADARIEAAESTIESYKILSKQVLSKGEKTLESIGQKTQAIVQQVKNGTLKMPRAQKQLRELMDEEKQVRGSIAECEEMTEQLEAAEPGVKALGNLGKDLESLENTMTSIKQAQGTLGKVMFGLDAATNFADLQARDPADPGKNALQAITMASTRMFAAIQNSKDMLTFLKANPEVAGAWSKMNATQAVVGLVNFGMNLMGMSDTPQGKMVNMAASGMPTEVLIKNVGMLTDMAVTLGKDAVSGGGNLKDWERINNDNLQGNNGPLAAASAMFGDQIATGGRNIPMRDMYKFGDTTGIFGMGEKLPGQLKGANTPAKVRMINDLLTDTSGLVTSGGAGENTIKLREMLTYGPPGQTVDVLKQLDKKKLVDNILGSHVGTNINQLTSTIQDLVIKANKPLTPADVRNELMNQVGQMVKACVPDHQQTLNQLNYLMTNDKLGEIPQNLRNLITDLKR